jgi:all-trans-retinol 13,14-reductase
VDVDSIVIGSGAGGLTAALALARGGDRVLVLEQHYLPGGWCHSFPLGGYQFNTGVHYVGTLGPGGALRRIYEGLEVTDELVFCELNPDGYDAAFIGGQRYRYRKGREQLTEGLASAFPAEAAGVRPSELLASQGASLRLVPAEQPAAWPEDLRAKFGEAEAEE